MQVKFRMATIFADLFLALTVLCISTIANAAQRNDLFLVNGKMSFDSKTISIKFGYALEVDNVEEAGYLQSQPQKFLVLVFSNRQLPLTSLSDRNAPFSDRHSIGELFEPLTVSPADKIHGILVTMDSKTFKIIKAQLLFPGKSSQFTVVGADIPDRITILKSKKGVLIGTASLATPQSTAFSDGPKKYQYKVNFQIPIRHETAVTQKWEGKEALTSPLLKSVKEYIEAGKSGDIKVLRELTASSHLAYLNNPEVLKMLKNGDASLLDMQVKRVVVRGNRASVTIVNEKPNFSIVSKQLIRESGIWKLYWP